MPPILDAQVSERLSSWVFQVRQQGRRGVWSVIEDYLHAHRHSGDIDFLRALLVPMETMVAAGWSPVAEPSAMAGMYGGAADVVAKALCGSAEVKPSVARPFREPSGYRIEHVLTPLPWHYDLLAVYKSDSLTRPLLLTLGRGGTHFTFEIYDGVRPRLLSITRVPELSTFLDRSAEVASEHLKLQLRRRRPWWRLWR